MDGLKGVLARNNCMKILQRGAGDKLHLIQMMLAPVMAGGQKGLVGIRRFQRL